MSKFLRAVFLFIILSTSVFSQNLSDKLQSLRLDAEYYFFNADYEKALQLFKEILKEDPENCNVNYKVGVCYQRMPFEAGRSINYLKKAVKEITADYIEGSSSERKAPVAAWYALARGYHTNKYYEEGVEAYQQYIDRLSPNDLQARKRAMREMISCRTASEIVKKPVPVEIFNVGNVINTEFNDFNPCPTADGKLMFFTRLEKQQIVFKDGSVGGIESKLRIYSTKHLDGDRWSAPVDITDELLTFGKCSILSINAEGTFMLLCKHEKFDTMNDLQQGGTLYYSTRSGRNSSWGIIKKFGKTINVPEASISQAAISADGQTLYVVSNKEGGQGGFDIWTSELKNKSKFEWSKLHNLGATINTEFNESSPYIMEDGRTLYFTSEGHYNMGGFDVFKSVKDEKGNWSEPENLGHPINTPDNNTFYKPAMDGQIGFYSVAFNEGYFTFGNCDIFQVEFTNEEEDEIVPATVKGTVAFEDKADAYKTARVYVRNAGTNAVVKELRPREDGSFVTSLPEGRYIVEFTCPNYLLIKREVTVERATKKQVIELNATLQTDDLFIIDDL